MARPWLVVVNINFKVWILGGAQQIIFLKPWSLWDWLLLHRLELKIVWLAIFMPLYKGWMMAHKGVPAKIVKNILWFFFILWHMEWILICNLLWLLLRLRLYWFFKNPFLFHYLPFVLKAVKYLLRPNLY